MQDKKWQPITATYRDGTILFVAKEDSTAVRSIADELHHRAQILDRCVLDMQAGTTRFLDRRIALALGVMLDTGERR